jgi:hypothetical protein
MKSKNVFYNEFDTFKMSSLNHTTPRTMEYTGAKNPDFLIDINEIECVITKISRW